jgi:hypothetical protein
LLSPRYLSVRHTATFLCSFISIDPRRSIAANALVPPALHGVPNQTPNDKADPMPDNAVIAQTANQIDQKGSPPVDAAPNAPVPSTTVTAVDGSVTNSSGDVPSGNSTRRRDLDRGGKRQSRFEKVYDCLPAGEHVIDFEDRWWGLLKRYLDTPL